MRRVGHLDYIVEKTLHYTTACRKPDYRVPIVEGFGRVAQVLIDRIQGVDDDDDDEEEIQKL